MRNSYFLRAAVVALYCNAWMAIALAQPTPTTGKMWEAVPGLTDEFDTWDASKWRKSLWNYGVPVQMVDANSGVTNGKLWIKATLDSGAERWFKSSRVMSFDGIKFPMYTECSMKSAHISAYTTYWLNNGNSINRDEIDICENNSKPSVTSQTQRPYTMYSQYFIVKNGVTERNNGDFDNRNLSDGNPAKGVKWNEAYQTLGMWWKDENHVQFYINGEPSGSVTTIQNFTLEQNIIWDLWTIDANWSGGIAVQSDLGDNSINTMYVDWIHTYKLVDDTTTVPPPDDTTALLEAGSLAGLKVYPNPATHVAHVNLPGAIQAGSSVRLFNCTGTLVCTQPITEAASELVLDELAPGLYLVQVQNGIQQQTIRLVKE